MLDIIKLVGPAILMIAGFCILKLKKLENFRQKHERTSIDLGVCLVMLGIMIESIFVLQFILR